MYGATGAKVLQLSGKWNSHVDATACDPATGAPAAGAVAQRLWTCAPKPEGDYYGFTAYAHKLNACEGIAEPLASDSRRRRDRLALEAGEMAAAGSEKHRLEEQQRGEAKTRKERGDEWAPRWFRAVPAPALLPGETSLDKVPFYEFTGAFLEAPAAPPAPVDKVRGAGFNPWSYAA